MTYKISSIVLLLAIFFTSCEESLPPLSTDNFDRTEMMENWVDDFILPGYDQYQQKVRNLSLELSSFQDRPSEESLLNLQEAYLEAYQAWQHISMYEIGKAESLGLRNYTNTFPTDINRIQENIDRETINLALPSTRTAQGFPALDYMLFEKMESEDLLAKLSTKKCREYLKQLVARLEYLSTEVKDSWNPERREEFTSNPESVDRMVNDFLFYYEKYLRAGKLGIPAGVFSGDPLPMHIEAPYSAIHSRSLLAASLEAVQAFFNGNNGLASYLQFMDKGDIADSINLHWNKAQELIDNLHPNLSLQIEDDNSKMLEVYDELQKAVILLKVDMLQALSIQVDYVDADGD